MNTKQQVYQRDREDGDVVEKSPPLALNHDLRDPQTLIQAMQYLFVIRG